MNEIKKGIQGLLNELERLVNASEADDFNFTLNTEGLSVEEAEAVRLLQKGIGKYREALEYEIVKYKLSNDALNIALWDAKVINGDPINPNNKITFSSEFRTILGFFDENDFPNELNSWTDLLHPDDKEATFSALMAHLNDLSGQTPYNVEYRLRLKNGEYGYFHGIGTTLRDSDGTPVRIAGALMDITEKKKMIEERRRTEIAEMANRAKTEFLATMSHEIRTPMNSILGFAELASGSDSVSEIKEFLDKISDSAKWLLHIINDILDISKIEAGKMEMDYVPFELHEVFSRCQSVILPDIKEKGLDLSIYTEKTEGKKFLGDPVRLYQVLMNLLTNAVKFTETGIIKFSSSIKAAENGNTTVYFEVKDSGIGMTAEQIDKVFDLFIQADSSTTRDYGGTGLGLTIAKNIVELMGGKLLVESKPGAGSTFSFEITFNMMDAAVNSPGSAPLHPKINILEQPYFDGLVLICDDNTMNQQVICAHLTRVGLKTIIVGNGRLGVQIVMDRKEKNLKPFDLILMDMFMPVMDGMEAASKILAMNTGTPIVAMTANVMISELDKYKKHGMPDCLGKPFTSQELWHILLKYLKPISSEQINAGGTIGEHEEHEELQKKLRINFLKENLCDDNQTILTRITDAVAAGDTKLAHRLAHSLKGNAALIGKTALRNAAADVEALLIDGIDSIWENKINNLKTELMPVLEELKSLYDAPSIVESAQQMPVLDSKQTFELFTKLEPMLKNNNTDCVDLLEKLRCVPGTQELIRQIEDFDFKSAVCTLVELKEENGGKP